MRSIQRLEASYEKKSAGKIKALYKKHHANYMLFWQMKQDLERFGLAVPDEVYQKWMHHWYLTNVTLNLPKKPIPAIPVKETWYQRLLRWLTT